MQTLGSENREKVEIFFKCEGLKKMDTFSKSDPRITLLEKREGKMVELGKTEVIEGTLDPVFKQSISADFIFQTKQVICLLIEDDDGSHKFQEIGRMDFELSKLVSSVNSTMKVEIAAPDKKPAGVVHMTAQKHVKDKYSYTIDLKCKDVKDLEWFSKSDPCVRVFRPKPQFASKKKGAEVPDGEWVKVHETEYKKDDLNPDFAPFEISGNKLCRGDENMVLKMEIWDFSKDGEESMKRIGKQYFTIGQLVTGAVKQLDTVDEKNKVMGTIVVEKATKTRTYDMIDYMNGGLSLNQVLMIDFTQSNGSVKDPSSLHFFDPKNTNQYEAAIQAIGSALFQYDRDAQIPVYGFGAKMPIIGVNDTKDFFYIQTSELAYASSIPQALKLYESAFEYIELAGPCRLSPGIKSTAEWVKGVAAVDHLFYAVLLILTDGEVEDMEETKAAIVDASWLPMSILIVGIGSKKFEQFKILDGDERKLKDKQGRIVARDIVQFVEFKPAKGLAELSEELLGELPTQVVDYFRMKKINPVGVL